MHIYRLKIPYRVLVEALHLPEGAKIVNIDNDWGGIPQTCEIYVEHPSASELLELEHCLEIRVEGIGDCSQVI